MAEQITYTGKDLEEAINNACSSLNTTREQLKIKITSPGSSGIFGLLRKKAAITVTLKEDDSLESENFSSPLPKPMADKQKNRSAHKKSYPKKPIQEKISSKNNEDTFKSPPKKVSEEVLAEIENSTAKILTLMGYPAEVSLSQDRGKVLVHIVGNNMETIIGEEGNTIDAIQYLVRKIVSHKFSEKIMLSMDAGDFRATRKKELEALALEMARLVKEGRKYKIIAPLNPAERRIIHVTLQTDNTIRSKSIGEGLFKKIKIYLPGQGKKHPGRKRPANRSKVPEKP